MLGEIVISGLIGFGVTLLARDRRGPSYGLLRAINAFVLVIILMYQSGFLALIVGLTALLGGYNGGGCWESVSSLDGRDKLNYQILSINFI